MNPPRITLILLAYNQQATARAAAESCLAQQCEPMEMVLSDDASTDATFAELQAAADAYRGPHQVRVRRSPVNLGIGAHYNALLRETSGELLVTAAGDDLAVPHRVQCLVAAWDATGQRADLIASHFQDMAADGTLGNVVHTDDLALLTLEGWCRRRPFTVGATHAFTRRMMVRFGPFLPGVWYEDPIMALRAITSGGAITLPEPLVLYRTGGSSHRPETFQGDSLVAWVRTQSRRVLAEIAQHTHDAGIVEAQGGDGVQAAVVAALEPARAREACLCALIDAPDVARRWHACRAAAALPLGWRLRKFLTFTFPDQAAGLKWLKARWRGGTTRWARPPS